MQRMRNAYEPRMQSSGVGLEERCALSHGTNFNRPASTSVHLQINNQCGVNFVEIEHDSNGSPVTVIQCSIQQHQNAKIPKMIYRHRNVFRCLWFFEFKARRVEAQQTIWPLGFLLAARTPGHQRKPSLHVGRSRNRTVLRGPAQAKLASWKAHVTESNEMIMNNDNDR